MKYVPRTARIAGSMASLVPAACPLRPGRARCIHGVQAFIHCGNVYVPSGEFLNSSMPLGMRFTSDAGGATVSRTQWRRMICR